jgi:importin subunit beta-1
LNVTARPDCDNTVRTAAYEVLNVFVQNFAQDSAASVAQLSSVILERLENTIPIQSQVVSVEDKITLEDMQTRLCSVMHAIIQRLDKEIVPQGYRIMQHTSSCAADTHTHAGAAFNTFPSFRY